MHWLFKPSKTPDMEAEKSTESTTQIENLRDKVVTAIKQVYDPEIPVDVYELGLIYEITVYPVNNVYVQMTLTSPNCPSAEFIPSEVKDKIQQIMGVNNVEVEVTFEPPYSQDMMSEVAKLELGFL
jgi:FeS assembly SUF system protein